MPAFEAALFNWTRNRQIEEEEHNNSFLFDMALPGLHDADAADVAGKSADELQIGQTIAALLDKDFMSKVMRYETSLQGRLSFTLCQLYDLRARRLKEERDD